MGFRVRVRVGIRSRVRARCGFGFICFSSSKLELNICLCGKKQVTGLNSLTLPIFATLGSVITGFNYIKYKCLPYLLSEGAINREAEFDYQAPASGLMKT